MESIFEVMAKQRAEGLQKKEERTAELRKLTNDKFTAEAIMELMPESDVVYNAVKDSLARGLDTDYVLSILKKHNLNGR